MSDEEKQLQLAEVPSNERDSTSKKPDSSGNNKGQNDNSDIDDVDIVTDSNNSNRNDLGIRDRLSNFYTDYLWLSVGTYFIFYLIYWFHFITFIIFVGDTAWPDSDYCKKFLSSSECKNHGDLCDWNEWDNSNGVSSDYCDASTVYTSYQLALLFYFGLYMLLWEVTSLLASFVTLVSLDQISKTPPLSNITVGTPDGNFGHFDNRGDSNKMLFRHRYTWGYNVFLPIKWIILGSITKCKSFDFFKYSLLASMSLDKMNILLEIGLKVVLNCVFAVWWRILHDENETDSDNITLCVFISSGLILVQNLWELVVMQSLDRKVYVLGH